MGKVQTALKTWSSGKCVDISNSRSEDIEWTILTADSQTPAQNSTTSRVKRAAINPNNEFHSLLSLDKRADCRDIQVVKDDGCASLAARCGIRGADFMKYNPKTDLCSTLKEKQWVCCSEGTLPDHRPKPQPNGVCAVVSLTYPSWAFQITTPNYVVNSMLSKKTTDAKQLPTGSQSQWMTLTSSTKQHGDGMDVLEFNLVKSFAYLKATRRCLVLLMASHVVLQSQEHNRQVVNMTDSTWQSSILAPSRHAAAVGGSVVQQQSFARRASLKLERKSSKISIPLGVY